MIDDELKQSRNERLERMKKDYKERPSGRPMGYIHPKAIQSILRGESPVSTFYYSDPAETTTKAIGDRWTDADGKEWEQKDGYKIRVSKIDLSDWKMPSTCPKCGRSMFEKEEKLNEKFWFLRKHCFDCQLKFETKIRTKGLWHEYQQSIMIPNIISFLTESKLQLEECLQSMSSNMQYVTEDGKLEKWDGDVSKAKEFIQKELAQINDDLQYLDRDLKDINLILEEASLDKQEIKEIA